MSRAKTQQSRTLGLVLKGYPRISETFISNEIRLMEERGFKIHIFSMRHPREAFSHASVKAIKAKVTYLPQSLLLGLPTLVWRNLLLFCTIPGRYLRGIGFLLSRFRLAKKKHTWLKHFLQAGWLVQKDFKAQNIGHFHAHFAHTPTSVAMYAAFLAGVPFSFFAHAKDIYTLHPQALREKIALARFTVTCTDYNQKHLQQLAGTDDHIDCVYHGIDLRLFNGNGRGPQAQPPYDIMTVARFVEKKGLPTVFAALRLLRQRGVEFRYTLIGDGPDKDTVLRALEKESLTDVTTLTGTIAHDQVLAVYKQADLFVLGCQEAADGDRDGIPNVVAESMAMGVPVAATTVSGLPELVQHGETGLLAQPRDPKALADNMQRLLTDGQFRARAIPAARKRVEEVFDNLKLIDDLADIYRREGIHPAQQD